MKLTKYIMACILAFSLAGCIDDEPSNNPITYGDGYFEQSSRRAGDHSL